MNATEGDNQSDAPKRQAAAASLPRQPAARRVTQDGNNDGGDGGDEAAAWERIVDLRAAECQLLVPDREVRSILLLTPSPRGAAGTAPPLDASVRTLLRRRVQCVCNPRAARSERRRALRALRTLFARLDRAQQPQPQQAQPRECENAAAQQQHPNRPVARSRPGATSSPSLEESSDDDDHNNSSSSSIVIREPRDSDVLAGKEFHHPGNVRHRQLVRQHAAEWNRMEPPLPPPHGRGNRSSSSSSQNDRAALVRQLNAAIAAAGGRFLERRAASDNGDGGWVELDAGRAYTKTDNALRYQAGKLLLVCQKGGADGSHSDDDDDDEDHSGSDSEEGDSKTAAATGSHRSPRKNDVIFPANGEHRHHPGNEQYRNLIQQYAPDWVAAAAASGGGGNTQRREVTRQVVGVVQALGGRFLKKQDDDGGGAAGRWIELDEATRHAETHRALRAEAQRQSLNYHPCDDDDDDDDDDGEEFRGASSSSEAITGPHQYDVTKRSAPHPTNNAFYKDLVRKHAAEWKSAPSHSRKFDVARKVNALVKEKGGRFLEQEDDGAWVEVDEKRSERKTFDALKYRARQLVGQDEAAEEPAIELRENDVVLGYEGRLNNHAGNVKFRDLIGRCATKFRDAKHKMVVVGQVMERIASLNGRFLERDESKGTWVEIDEERVEIKIRDGLRHRATTCPTPAEQGSTAAKRKASDENDCPSSRNASKKAKATLQEGPIRTPGKHDVLAGSGKDIFNHPGNVLYRKYVRNHLAEWIRGQPTKRSVEARVIAQVEALGGRFLEKDKNSPGCWVVMDKEKALIKTFQSFRRDESKADAGNLEDTEPPGLLDAENIHTTGIHDVLKGGSKHSGNIQYRKWLQEYVHEYSESTRKIEVTQKLIAKVASVGGRFLERSGQNGDAWVEMNPNQVKRNVNEVLRREANKFDDADTGVGKMSVPNSAAPLSKSEGSAPPVGVQAADPVDTDAPMDRVSHTSSQVCTSDRASCKDGGATGVASTTTCLQNSSSNGCAPASHDKNSAAKKPSTTKQLSVITNEELNAAKEDENPCVSSTDSPAGARALVLPETKHSYQAQSPQPSKRQTLHIPIPQSEVTERDVLFQADRAWPGNSFFMSQLELLSQIYDTKTHRLQIATDAFDRIAQNGGRFLKPVEAAVGSGQQQWVERDRHEMIAEIRRKFYPSPEKPASPQRSAMKEEDPDECTERDVLFCDESFVATWPGNVYFRQLIGHFLSTYPTNLPNIESTRKSTIARQAIEDVIANGGRFLRPISDAVTGPECLQQKIWVEQEMDSVVSLTCESIPGSQNEEKSACKSICVESQKPFPSSVTGAIPNFSDESCGGSSLPSSIPQESATHKESRNQRQSIADAASRKESTTNICHKDVANENVAAGTGQGSQKVSLSSVDELRADSQASTWVSAHDHLSSSAGLSRHPSAENHGHPSAVEEEDTSTMDTSCSSSAPIDPSASSIDVDKASAPFLLPKGNTFHCALCSQFGIQKHQITGHCRRVGHCDRLRSAPFLSLTGEATYGCSLCNCSAIRDVRLAAHCFDDGHVKALAEQARSSKPIQSNTQPSYDIPRNNGFLNDGRPRPRVSDVDSEAFVPRDSAPFLVKGYRDERTGKFIRNRYQCTLCQVCGIYEQHVANHCRKEQHVKKLAFELRQQSRSDNRVHEPSPPYPVVSNERSRDRASLDPARRPGVPQRFSEERSVARRPSATGDTVITRLPSLGDKAAGSARRPSYEGIPSSDLRMSVEGTRNHDGSAIRRGSDCFDGRAVNVSGERYAMDICQSFSKETSTRRPLVSEDAATKKSYPPTGNQPATPTPLYRISINSKSVNIWNRSASVLLKKSGGKMPESDTTLTAKPDQNPTLACTQNERPLTKVTYVPSQILTVALAEQVSRRLEEWDPFWETLSFVGMGLTYKVQSLDPNTDLIKTAAVYNLALPLHDKHGLDGLPWGKKRGAAERNNGDVALLLRMLPVNNDTYRKKRADCHLWPKGTFLQINGERVPIVQRMQQWHNHLEWKSLCRHLDLTELIQDPKQKNNFQFFCFDDQQYVFVLSVCRYRSAKQLQTLLMDPNSNEAITVLPREACFDKAMRFVSPEMSVNLDSDDDVEEENEDARKFVYSLLCPVSKTVMKTPVRGKNCKHFQCFDLESYLSSNTHVSGSRWRCASCENFVSLQNLEVCSLTSHLLREFASAASDRDRVELCADRSYKLLQARQPRSRKRRAEDMSAADNNALLSVKRLTNSSEVIDLL